MKKFKSKDFMQKTQSFNQNSIISVSNHYKYNRFRDGGWGHRYKDLPHFEKLMKLSHTEGTDPAPGTNPVDQKATE